MQSLRGWSIGALIALLLAGPGRAQEAPPAFDADFSQALQAFQADRVDEAIDLFEGIVEADPAFVLIGQGAAAYWLGRAYEADGDPESVREVWQEGVESLLDAERFDPRLAGAFVRLTFSERHGTDYALAARAYLWLLEALDWYPYVDEEAALVRGHLETLTIVVPRRLQQETGLDHVEREGLTALADEAGARLVAWWRSRDVAPSSRNNEPLEEHLDRAFYAEAHYRYQDAFDDRGLVYIRFGKPSHVTHITFDDLNFRNKVVDRSLTLNMSDFPENEFWVYEHIGQDAQFLFYSEAGPYRLGEVRDLLPSVLRNGLGSSGRGKAKARAVIRTLDEIYQSLSLYHPTYAAIYQEVASFSGLLDESEVAEQASAEMQAQQGVVQQDGGNETLPQAARDAMANGSGAAFSASMPGSTFNADRPDLFALSILSQAQVEDDQAGLRRAEYMPPSYSNAFDDAEPLPTIARWARFLDDDGSTRTEVYWGIPPGALEPSKRMRKAIIEEGYEARDYLLLASLVQKSDDYQDRVVNYHRHVLPDLADARDASLAPQAYVVRGDTGRYHIAMQWDQYTVTLDERAQPVVLGMRVKANTFRADSLHALNRDEGVLEMSDLKPMTVLDPDPATETEAWLDDAMLYPFSTLEPQTPLLLYFEIYHLAFGADDQTKYTVAYEVRRKEGPGGILRFLGGDQEESTAAETDYTGTSRTAKEHVLLDFTTWEGQGDLDVTVRVTDRVTGREVARTILLALVKGR